MNKAHLRDKAWLFGGGMSNVRALSHEDFLRMVAGEEGEVRTCADAYAQIVWVYRCVNLRAHVLAGLPWSVYDAAGNEVAWDLPMTQLLYQIEAALCLAGASFVLKQLQRRRLVGLQWLNPSTMTVEYNSEGISGFRQNVAGRAITFTPDDIIYHRLFNPHDDLGPGVPPARVALSASKLAWAANTYAQKFFESGAVPAVILTTETVIPEAERQEIKSAWERLFGGVRKAFRTAVLQHGLKPTIVGSQFKDIMMKDVLTQARQQIAVAFGIPQTLLEDAANFATAREHRLSLYNETIFPEADLIADGLNEQLFAPLGLEFRFRYEDVEAVQQDEATKAAAIVQLYQTGIITRDEAREQLGFEVAPQQTTPSGVSAEAKQEVARWKRKVKRKGTDEFESVAIPGWLHAALRYRLSDTNLRDYAFEPCLRAFDRGEVESKLTKRLTKEFKEVFEDIAKKVGKGKLPDEELDRLNKALTSALTMTLSNIVADKLLELGTELGVGFDYAEAVTDAAAWAAQYAYDLVKGIDATQRAHLQQIISQVADGKMTADDAVAALEPLFGEVRAEMIATTEVTRALSQAGQMYADMLRERGMEINERWLTAEDERVCEICGPLDHKLKNVWGEQFPDGPPAHPNCRCQIVIEWA